MTFSINPELLEILRCPETMRPLRIAEDDLIGRINAAIAGGQVKNKAGEAVAEALQSGLLREDEALVYPVRDDIPVLLVEEGITLDQLTS